MTGWLLRFFVQEGERHRGKLLWEWLLGVANELGVRGGSAFRSIGGFGRHHVVHEQRFFELAGDTAVQVEFTVTDAETQQLLARLQAENIRLFYTRMPVEFGILNPDPTERPTG